ncbi:MAG: RNA 2',3'-cyclic phosphodiesterase [Sedimentisphaerales bacterium]|nr:RNA 2',3'-cyclic phosphodiesterase [Sedimentisphaerales bacterium]
MRCFIAIDIDENMRKAFADLEQQMQTRTRGENINKSDVKWVQPEHVHITLKFLGEVKDKQISEVCNIVGELAKQSKGFELDIESVGHFGGKSARVLWVGTGEGGEELRLLAEAIDEHLSLAGWPKETREFSGHLTLCRIRNTLAGLKLAQMSKEYKDFKLGAVSVDSLSVYQSELTPSGPNYTVLVKYELQ